MSSILVILSIAHAFDPTPSDIVEGRIAPIYGPHATFVGDLNGDGFDEVLVNLYGGLELYPGTPTGPAAQPARVWLFPAANTFGRRGHAIGDVNGDGYDDMAISVFDIFSGFSTGHRVEIRLGSSAGPAELPDLVLEGTGNTSSDVALAYGDCNGDGIDDLFVGDAEAAEVNVYVGGVGGLGATPASTFAYPGLGRDVAIGDMNGDGFLDVLAAVHEAEGKPPQLFVGDGACGYVDQWELNASSVGNTPQFVAFVDFDGDGVDSMVMTDGPVMVFDGSYPFDQTHFHSTTSIWLPTDAERGDVDGDGYEDLVVAGVYNRVVLYGGTGRPTLGSYAEHYGFDFGQPLHHLSASLGDANGDGQVDLLESSDLEREAAYTEGPLIEDYAPTKVWDTPDQPSRLGLTLARGDVNGDGFTDIVASCASGLPFSEGGTCVFLGGAGGLEPQPREIANDGAAILGDIDQDGIDDLIVTWAASQKLHIYLGSINGPSSSPDRIVSLDISADDVDFHHDFDGDGLLDLALRTDHEVAVALGTVGGLEAPTTVFATNQLQTRLLGYADANGDGHADIFVQGIDDADVAWVPFSPTGAAVASPMPIGLSDEAYPNGMVSGDFDGDGYDDVAFHEQHTFSTRKGVVLFGSSSGLDPTSAVPLDGAALWAGDLDGDGYDDLVTGYPEGGDGQGEVAVYAGGVGGIQPIPEQVLYGTDDEALGKAATAADVDGDGQLELVVGASDWGAMAGRLLVFEP